MFKSIDSGTVTLNHWEIFWVVFEATHISFKNGKGRSWFKLGSDRWPNRKSTNNHRFIEVQGNSYSLPEFYFSASGYHYGSITWAWRCRNCREEVTRNLLDSKEICSQCNDGFVKKRGIPL